MLRRVNKITKVFSYLLLAVILFTVANKAFFIHSHQLANGEIVFHQHPFKKANSDSQQSNHQHSDFETVFLSNLDVQVFFALAVILLLLSFTSFNYQSYSAQLIPVNERRRHSGRAPPVI